MRRIGQLLVGFLLLAAIPAPAQEVERFELPNGLTILVQVDRRLPLVNVTSLYRVGSANEAPGNTGIAHYVEHMNFRATENVSPADVTGSIERIGGRWNGYTSLDQTLYAATVPTWALESVLRIEAERMARARFDPTEFERERSSVISELQGYENDPASRLWDLVLATSFELHPYRYNIIGWLADVQALTREEAYRFYREYYGPNQAVLAIVGDLDPGEVRRLVRRHFGRLRPAPRAAAVRVVEPPQQGEKRVDLLTPGNQQHLLVVFRAPAATAADFPVLLVLDALLSEGRGLLRLPGPEPAGPSSRLQKAVEEAGGRVAGTSLTPTRAPFVYALSATAAPAADLARLEAALTAELTRIGREGVSQEELEGARQRLRAATALESPRLAEVAHRLAYYEALGGWERVAEIRRAVEVVTPADLQAYVRRWLRPEQRTVGRHRIREAGEAASGVPGPSSLPPPAPPVRPSPVPERALQPLPRPPVPSLRRRLENGVVVRVARSSWGEAAALQVRLGFGSALDPPGREGLALVAARLLSSDPELESLLGARGGALWSTAQDSPTDLSTRECFDLRLRVLAADWEAAVETVGRSLAVRSYSPAQIERVRNQLLEELAGFEEDPSWVAEERAVRRAQPDWHPAWGSRASLLRITPEEVNGFLERHLRGGAVWVSLVGPDEPARLEERMSAAFSGLPAGEPPEFAAAHPAPEPGEERLPRAGKTQVEVVAALPGLSRTDSDALPLQLLNYVLGETGYAGRLGDALVDSGLVYSVYSAPEFGRTRGPLRIRTGTATQNLEATLAALRRVLGQLAEQGVAEWELREAQAYRLGRMVLEVESEAGLARTLVEGEYFGEDGLDFPRRSAEILAVSRERLRQAAGRTLRPQDLGVAAAGAIPAAPE